MTEQEFNDIATTERRELVKTARRMLGGEAEAADAAQEALVNLWLFRDRVDMTLSVAPLLQTMVRNICLMYLRRRKARLPHLGLESIPPNQLRIIATSGGDPHQDMEAQERARAVREALTRIAPHHQALLQMHYSVGLSIQQIANIQDTTASAVKQMLFRARQALKAEIERRNP